jgi:hypothetical protein
MFNLHSKVPTVTSPTTATPTGDDVTPSTNAYSNSAKFRRTFSDLVKKFNSIQKFLFRMNDGFKIWHSVKMILASKDAI